MAKYRKGDRITTVSEMVEQEFIYHNHKILHKGWFLSWQVMMAINAIKWGHVYYAVKKEPKEETA